MLAGVTELQVFAYTGQDYDGETGLYHFHARYYDAVQGTWLTQDSYRGKLRSPVTLHRYRYLHKNPINSIDWLGFAGCGILGLKCKASEAWEGIKTVGGNIRETATTSYEILKNGVTNDFWGTDEQFEYDKIQDQRFDEIDKRRQVKAEYTDTMEQLQDSRRVITLGFRGIKGQVQLVHFFSYDPVLVNQLSELSQEYYLSKLKDSELQAEGSRLMDIYNYRMVRAEAGLQTIGTLNDLALSLNPVSAPFYSGFQFVTGYNPNLDEHLNWDQRAMAGLDMVAGLAQLDKFAKTGKAVRTLTKIGDVAGDISDVYKAGSIVNGQFGTGKYLITGEEMSSEDINGMLQDLVVGKVSDKIGDNVFIPQGYEMSSGQLLLPEMQYYIDGATPFR